MSKLSREHVLKLAQLSSLSLSEEEINQFQDELGSILEYVGQLEKVDTSGLQPTYQVTGLENAFRADVVTSQLASSDDLLECVPTKKDRYIQVGRMI